MVIQHRWGVALRSGLLVAALLLAAGCGSSAATATGTVKWQGKPLAAGGIMFTPEDAQANKVNGPIIDGSFTIPSTDGLRAGKYKVSISSKRKTGKKAEDSGVGEMATEVLVETIPGKFNTETTLQADLKGGENKLEYDLK